MGEKLYDMTKANIILKALLRNEKKTFCSSLICQTVVRAKRDFLGKQKIRFLVYT